MRIPNEFQRSLSFIAVLFAAASAVAQMTNLPFVYAPTSIGYTNYIPATTNYAVPSGVIEAKYHSEIGVQCRYQLTGAGTDTLSFPFGASLDGTNFSQVAIAALPASGTNLVTTNFSISLNALGYFRFEGPNNSNSVAATNLAVLITPKPSRRDNF